MFFFAALTGDGDGLGCQPSSAPPFFYSPDSLLEWAEPEKRREPIHWGPAPLLG